MKWTIKAPRDQRIERNGIVGNENKAGEKKSSWERRIEMPQRIRLRVKIVR